jgi:hypothetical protein
MMKKLLCFLLAAFALSVSVPTMDAATVHSKPALVKTGKKSKKAKKHGKHGKKRHHKKHSKG